MLYFVIRTLERNIHMKFNIDPQSATMTFLPCGCVEYPQLDMISMGEIRSKKDLKLIHDLLVSNHIIDNKM